MLDQAFEALKTFDWGTDRSLLNPIDDAVVTTRDDVAARQDLEDRLAAVLAADVTRDAKDFVCRQLMVIGTGRSVAALAAMLANPELSHMARYALERIPAAEAGQALRDALPQTEGVVKIGIISSLGVRGDADSVAQLAALLGDSDECVACAAAYALGDIRTKAAANSLGEVKGATPRLQAAVSDAVLSCAEALLANGSKADALAVYKRLCAQDQPKHVRLAATRGVLACTGKAD